MARGKKKETLTPEERLQAALVPVSEQPYKVPGNWCWTYIKFGFDVTSSKRVHKEDWLSQGIPFYRTRELVKLSENGCVDNELFISEKLYNSFVAEYGVPQKGDLLISGVGTIGVPYVINENQKFYFKDGNIIWFKNRGLFHPKYVYFLYKSTFIDNQIHQMSSGTTVDTYTIINANATVVPLPPFSEQQRIIDRIESLFAKLDEAKQKAQDALDSFETRKAAILHRAFTGELTAQWRKEHGVGMESWENLKIGTYAQVKGGKRLPKGHKLVTERTTHPYLRIADFGDGTINDSDLNYITEDTFSQIKNYIINKEDVYISIVGSIGKAGVIPESLNGANLTENAARIISSRTLPRYLSSFLSSPKAQNDIQNRIRSATLGKLSLLNIKDIETPVPSIEEQTEIVRFLDDLLAKEQQAKEAAEGVLEQIDLIKKAILARAFRGELGTNDPSEESAQELIKNFIFKM